MRSSLDRAAYRASTPPFRLATAFVVLVLLMRATRVAASFEGALPLFNPTPLRAGKPRVGVCIVGGLRTWCLAQEALFERFLDQLQPDPAYRVLIAQVNDDIAQCRANPMTCPNCPRWCEENANKSMSVVGDLIKASEEFHLNEEITCKHPRVRDQPLCEAWPHAHERPDNERRGGSWSFGQYMNRHVCLQRLVEYERKTGTRFDVVTLIRPDMYFFDVVPNAEFFMRMRPRIIFGSKEVNHYPADYVYIVPRSLLETLMDLLWRAYGEGFRRRTLYSAPEERIASILLGDRKIPYQMFPIHFTVLRHGTVAECWRLHNHLFHSTRLRHPSDGKIRGVEDDCKVFFPGEPGDR